MRKIVFLPLFFVFATSFAQDSELMQKTADTICKCMSKANLKDNATQQDLQDAFMTCFATAGMTYVLQLAEERKVEITDQKAMEGLGMEIGKELLKQNCQAFIKYSVITAKRDNEGEAAVQQTEGILSRVDNKDFRYLVVKDKSGREQSYIWLDYFDGSDDLTGDKIKNFIGKKVTISWKEREVYLPSAGNYFKIKQIAGFTISK
jgi:hypothetical protein